MKRILIAILGLGLAFSLGAFAADEPSADAVKDKIAKLLGIDRSQVRPAPVSGWYEVQHDHDFGYVSTDGKYLLQGDLVNIDTGERITENRRRADRLAALNKLGSDNMIEFAPQPPIAAKYTVTVFTDLDCPYCRKLHSQIDQYNAKGIAVRYVFFPRHGIGSPTYFQAISVWCSSNRQQALTQAKLGNNTPAKKCENPVDQEYKLAVDLAITGTPGIILPDGTLYGGYAPPDELAAILAKSDADDKAAAAAAAKSKG
ncbi:MAG: thioredoxin fold domain-containing protein [Nevskiales bacterium]